MISKFPDVEYAKFWRTHGAAAPIFQLGLPHISGADTWLGKKTNRADTIRLNHLVCNLRRVLRLRSDTQTVTAENFQKLALPIDKVAGPSSLATGPADQ